MHAVVGTYVSFGTPIYIAIANFQTRFQMKEEYWPYDSIKKDFFRLRDIHEIDLNDYAYRHLEQLILINMSNAGAVSENLLKKHAKTEFQNWISKTLNHCFSFFSILNEK